MTIQVARSILCLVDIGKIYGQKLVCNLQKDENSSTKAPSSTGNGPQVHCIRSDALICQSKGHCPVAHKEYNVCVSISFTILAHFISATKLNYSFFPYRHIAVTKAKPR